jgi:hypothetical protein
MAPQVLVAKAATAPACWRKDLRVVESCITRLPEFFLSPALSPIQA